MSPEVLGLLLRGPRPEPVQPAPQAQGTGQVSKYAQASALLADQHEIWSFVFILFLSSQYRLSAP